MSEPIQPWPMPIMRGDGAYVFTVPTPPDVVKAIEAALRSAPISHMARIVDAPTVTVERTGTVYVATFGMHYDTDEVVAVGATLAAARAAVEAHARDRLCDADLEFAWQPARDGRGEFCTLMSNWTATLLPFEVLA